MSAIGTVKPHTLTIFNPEQDQQYPYLLCCICLFSSHTHTHTNTGDCMQSTRGGHLSLMRFTAEGTEGSLPYWGPWVMNRRLWRWVSLFIGAQLGNLEWVRLLGTSREGGKERWRCGVSLCGSSGKVTWSGFVYWGL